MKKILFAVLASTFATALMGADLVYDYKASIKRIDPVYKGRTVVLDGVKKTRVTESYNVVSDTISGYIVIKPCKACDEDGIDSSLDLNDGTAYLVRKGDKYAKKNGKPFVLRAPVGVKSYIFGAYTIGQEDPVLDPQGSDKDAKKAWMALSYTTNIESDTLYSEQVLPKYGDRDPRNEVLIGFLGLDVLAGADITQMGFGTVKFLTQKEKGSIGFCTEDPDDVSNCKIINTISGTLIGDPIYLGLCGATPMWDLCYSDGQNNGGQAVITGTWTLKFNSTLSNAEKYPVKEDIILEKLKADVEDVADAVERN